MDFLAQALWFIVAISVLVAAHEFGHYWVARRLGFKVLRFSIGFGRPLLSWRGKAPDHVEYWVSAIPLGGYVKMLDEHEGEVPSAERHRAFHQRPIWQRVAVLLAGPVFNFLFAILAYWLMFVTGVDALKPVVATVNEGSLADRAGIVAGDEIEAVAGQPTPTWEAATLKILDEIVGDGRIELTVRDVYGATHEAVLDVPGRAAELTDPAQLFPSLGFERGPAAVAGTVEAGSPAERAGLEAGDLILAVNGESIEGWNEWVEALRARAGERIELTVLRNDAELALTATLESRTESGVTYGYIGVGRRPLFTVQRYGLVDALPRAVDKTWEFAAFSVSMMGNMVMGQVSLKNLSGPLAIADIARDSAAIGLAEFLNVLAALSISLGILNLLPIPLLDGGQIVYQLIEWAKGSPLSERALVIGQQLGIAFVLALTGLAFYNDILRMLGT